MPIRPGLLPASLRFCCRHSLQLLAGLWLGLVPATASAQSTTGSLQGRVVTLEGEPVPDVSVVVHSAALQGRRERVTDRDGFFQVLALPPGQYTLRLSRIGLRALVVRDVPVDLGNTSTLGDVEMQVEPMTLEPIVVQATELGIDPVHTTVGATLHAEDFALLPGERDYKSAITMLPQVNESYRGDVANIGGQSGPETTYFIDGMNATSPMWGGAVSTRLPYNFVRAVEVKEGGYEAQYGKALGAVVNAITYSGTNELEMEVFGFTTTSDLAANSKAEPLLRTGAFLSYDLGARVSGPVVEDRLWYSLAYNPKIERAGREISGYGLYTDRSISHLFAGKLTWQAAPPVSLELSILGDPSVSDQVAPAWAHYQLGDASAGSPDSFLARAESGGVTGSLHATAMVGEYWLLEASAMTARFRDNLLPRTAGGNAWFLMDWLANEFSGGLPEWYAEGMSRTAAALRSTLTLGRHTLTAGAEYEVATVNDAYDLRVLQLIEAGTFYDWREQTRGRTVNRVPTTYLQDSWRATDRLTLNAGLRWSGEYLVGQRGTVAQSFPNEWQPRVGFVLQLGPLGSQRFFGSYGRFFQNEPGNLPAIHYKDYRTYLRLCQGDPRQPGAVCDSSQDQVRSADDFVDAPGHPQMDNLDEFVLGYEAKLGELATVGIRGIRRHLRSSFQWGWYFDPFGAGALYSVLGTPGAGDFNFLPRTRREYTALEVTAQGRWQSLEYRASYVLSRSWGNYTGFFDADEGSLNPGGNGMYEVPQQVENATGLLPNDRTHVAKLSAAYRTPFGVSLGAIGTVESGTPLNAIGAAGPSTLGNLWSMFLVPRGTVGRSPSLWNLDVRLTYDAPCPGTRRCRAIVDALHLGNPQKPAWLDERQFADMDMNGNQIAPNPHYLQPLAYQQPMTLRLGFEVGF